MSSRASSYATDARCMGTWGQSRHLGVHIHLSTASKHSACVHFDEWYAYACVAVFVHLGLTLSFMLCSFALRLVCQKPLAMIHKKSLRNVFSAQHLVATHEVTDWRSEVVLQKCLLCDNPPKATYHGIHKNHNANHDTQYLHTHSSTPSTIVCVYDAFVCILFCFACVRSRESQLSSAHQM